MTEKRTWRLGQRSLFDLIFENVLSALQHIRHIQPGSPVRTMRMVRLVTLEVSVAQLPKKVRMAILRSVLLVLSR